MSSLPSPWARAARAIPIADAAAGSLLFLLNIAVIFPFLMMDFSSEPWNNDYIYIGMTRMFRDHAWTWNALEHGGAPFRYLYPPIFHLLSAAAPFASLGRSFHLVSGLGYALLPVAVYAAARQLFRSRVAAGVAGLLYGVAPSPIYYLLPAWGSLAVKFHHAPWGFVTLVGYNEAAHTLAAVFLLLAVAAAWRDRWTWAAVLGACVLLTNWAGAVALAMVLGALALSRYRTGGIRETVARVLGAGGVAYGLAAFWITAGFIHATRLLDQVVLRNEQQAPAPWNQQTTLLVAVGAVLIGFAAWRKLESAAAFCVALLAMSGTVVIAFTLAGNYLVPLPHRYMLELNVAIALLAGKLVDAAGRWRPAAALILILGVGIAARAFIANAWNVQQRSADPKAMAVYPAAEWLVRNAGGARVLAAGELEGSLKIWGDVAQVSGGQQDISNFVIPAAHREMTFGCEAASRRIARLWITALDVGFVVLHEPRSREYFHRFVDTEQFLGFPVAWTDGAGNTIYRVPGWTGEQAVVVDEEQLRGIGPLRATNDPEFLERYVAWARGKRPARIHWTENGAAALQADARPGEAVLVKVNHESGWRVGGARVESDPIGFLLIRGAARGKVSLRYGATWDVWLGYAVFLGTVVLLAARVRTWRIAVAAMVPSLVAYAVLASQTPPQVAAAEQAYRRLQPPIINPGGIVDGATGKLPLVRGAIGSVFGVNFGASRPAKVIVDGREARVVYHGSNLFNFVVPEGAAPESTVTVDVNGCRGNSFVVPTRASP